MSVAILSRTSVVLGKVDYQDLKSSMTEDSHQNAADGSGSPETVAASGTAAANPSVRLSQSVTDCAPGTCTGGLLNLRHRLTELAGRLLHAVRRLQGVYEQCAMDITHRRGV